MPKAYPGSVRETYYEIRGCKVVVKKDRPVIPFARVAPAEWFYFVLGTIVIGLISYVLNGGRFGK